MLWVVLISGKGGYRFHSAHLDKTRAEIFDDCKKQDGEDTAVLILERDDMQDLQSMIEKALNVPPVK